MDGCYLYRVVKLMVHMDGGKGGGGCRILIWKVEISEIKAYLLKILFSLCLFLSFKRYEIVTVTFTTGSSLHSKQIILEEQAWRTRWS